MYAWREHGGVSAQTHRSISIDGALLAQQLAPHGRHFALSRQQRDADILHHPRMQPPLLATMNHRVSIGLLGLTDT